MALYHSARLLKSAKMTYFLWIWIEFVAWLVN
jgi:hypothetical protein